MTLTNEEHKAGASEILAQLGGRQFIAMTGAKFISYDSTLPGANLSLRFQGSKIANHITINLNGSDTYDVKFFKIGKKDFKVVSEFNGIYNEDLRSLFTRVTGLLTSLGIMGR